MPFLAHAGERLGSFSAVARSRYNRLGREDDVHIADTYQEESHGLGSEYDGPQGYTFETNRFFATRQSKRFPGKVTTN